MSAYSKPGTPLDTVDTTVHKTNEASILIELMFWWKKRDDKHICEIMEVVGAKTRKKKWGEGIE